jgi:hypothetical protein
MENNLVPPVVEVPFADCKNDFSGLKNVSLFVNDCKKSTHPDMRLAIMAALQENQSDCLELKSSDGQILYPQENPAEDLTQFSLDHRCS